MNDGERWRLQFDHEAKRQSMERRGTNYPLQKKIRLQKIAFQGNAEHLYVLLTVQLGITLLNNQLEAQFFYFIIRLLQSSTCFEQRRAHIQEVKLY